MKAERDDDKEPESQQLDDETDFHDCVASLLGRYVGGHAQYTTENLNKEGEHVAGDEDRGHKAGRDPETPCIAKGLRCYVEDDSALIS